MKMPAAILRIQALASVIQYYELVTRSSRIWAEGRSVQETTSQIQLQAPGLDIGHVTEGI